MTEYRGWGGSIIRTSKNKSTKKNKNKYKNKKQKNNNSSNSNNSNNILPDLDCLECHCHKQKLYWDPVFFYTLRRRCQAPLFTGLSKLMAMFMKFYRLFLSIAAVFFWLLL